MTTRQVDDKQLSRIRIVIADDQIMFREMLVSTFIEEEDLEVVGQASNGEEAVRLCLTLKPDILLLDINMPRMNGITATRAIVASCPATRVVILSAFDDDQYVLELARAGAKGYILKESHSDEVLRAIRTAFSNDSLWEPRIQNKILREMGRLLDERDARTDRENTEGESRTSAAVAAQRAGAETEALPAGRSRAVEALTDREKEVLTLMGRGFNNREICETLFISEPTVKTHVSNVMQKMGFRDRVEAALFASRNDR